jgi:hypothetical protein
MMRNETKDSDLPCHTMDPRGRWWGGVGRGGGGELAEIAVPQHAPLAPPLFKIEHYSRLRAGADFVGLFIGHYYRYRLA